MSVTIVIVTFHSEATLPACLDSLPRDADVVVVDNASDDRSAAIAEAAGAFVIRNVENRGFAAGANQGARHGSGDMVLFLNPDAALADGCIVRMAAALEAEPGLAVVGPAAIDSPDGPLRGLWPFPSASRTWVNELGLRRLTRPRESSQGFVVGTCMLVRRAWFERLGGFDERFWLYGEDADFCRRALALGGRSATVNGAGISHIGGHSSKQLASSFEHFHRGAELFIASHSGRLALASHRCAVLYGALIRSTLFAPFDRTRSGWFFRLAKREAGLLVRSPLAVE